MLAFGMPMGPIELADTVGLDIAMAAGKQLAGAAEPPRCLLERVARGRSGQEERAAASTLFRDGKAQRAARGAAAGWTWPRGWSSR